MAHLPDFISDLAIILITASIITILFKWLKQPVVLGYIVAGLIASLHFKRFVEKLVIKITGAPEEQISNIFNALPEISDMANVSIWAEIGVIFLLFALGLEFSFKKLMDVGGKASIATLINLGSMIIIGYLAGQLFIVNLIDEWTQMDSIFLGCMLSMSSTTIIIKAFNDMGLQKKKFAGIVFGMLIVEDLAAIVMMVLLSTFAVSHHFETEELANSVVSLLFFMLIWFVVGIYMIPTMLKKLKKYLNDETLLIVAIGLCLGMVYFATAVGFSAALGAFIMGSILAETIESKHIEHLIEPLKNLFGAIFFVSVGMMIDPAIIIEYGSLILILTAVILIGRPFFAAIGVLASGEGLKVAVQSGFSLAQIGEFSFIIASLGLSLGVITETLYPIIIAVSVITTFTTPYCIKYSDSINNWLEKRIPDKWDKLIQGYGASSYNTINQQNHWKKLLKSILSLVAIYFAISIAILLIFQNFITPYIVEWMPGSTWGPILAAAITLTLMAPFLRAIMMKKNRSEEFRSLWQDNRLNRGALISLIVFRITICIVLILMVLIPLFPRLTVLMVIISLAVVTLIIFSQGFKVQSQRIEARFLENLNLKQRLDEEKAAILPTVANDLRSKNIHIEEFDISQSSPSIGKSLRDLNFKQKTGVNIVTIIRGSKKINIPDGSECLYPFDKLVVAGSDEEMQQLSQYLQDKKTQIMESEEAQHHISLSQYIIEPESLLIGMNIANSGVKEKTECMIIGVDRKDQSIIQFDSGFVFEEGDILWLAGERDKLNSFEENISNKTHSIS